MIGILTFHQVYNYGAVLQAYGLQKFLEENEYDVEIIDVKAFIRPRPSVVLPSFSTRYVKYLIKKTFDKEFKKIHKTSTIKANKFDNFRTQYLNLSKEYSSLMAYSDENKLDAIIVGSDQVWNPKYGKKAMETFFIKGLFNNIKKIGYAGCIGSGSVKYDILDKFADNIDRFTSISTRDEFSKNYLSKWTKKPIENVGDPSLLIDWSEIDIDLSMYELPEKYIFIYGVFKNKEDILKRLKEELNLPIVLIGMENEYKSSVADIVLNDVGPLEWVGLLRKSSFVITKSFHGFMFSLMFNKQMFVFSSGTPAISRLQDMCIKLGIEDIIIENSNEIKKNIDLQKLINYDNVNKILKKYINKSKQFLLNALINY